MVAIAVVNSYVNTSRVISALATFKLALSRITGLNYRFENHKVTQSNNYENLNQLTPSLHNLSEIELRPKQSYTNYYNV